jgi:endonuclease YncB( thermonuclease family)
VERHLGTGLGCVVTTQQYVYRVTEVVKVTDGDTYWLRLDVGFRQEILIDCRLDGWDAPEMTKGSDYEKQQAKIARQVASDWLTAALKVGLWIRTEKDPDDFGRWLGDLWTETSDGLVADHLGMALASQKLASAWPTRWHEVYDQ